MTKNNLVVSSLFQEGTEI